MHLSDTDAEYEEPTFTVEAPCPGVAHRRGEECMVCDPERDGRIDVVLTAEEYGALVACARGFPIEARFVSRLARLGLVAESARWTPTQTGLAVVSKLRLRAA